jgi:hypothetical protein
VQKRRNRLRPDWYALKVVGARDCARYETLSSKLARASRGVDGEVIAGVLVGVGTARVVDIERRLISCPWIRHLLQYFQCLLYVWLGGDFIVRKNEECARGASGSGPVLCLRSTRPP